MADLMYECEAWRPFNTPEGTKEFRWTPLPVRHVNPETRVRCMHCHGAVRIHRQKVEHGPQDHVEHTLGNDTKYCRAGYKFQPGSQHQMSASPVT